MGKKMRKNLAIALALTFLVSFTCTALAASPNPFGDVPAKHWSYDAVNKLKNDGIIDGDGKGNFGGDRTVTRYEMAQMVARAVWNVEKANAEDKALIDKLSAEFNSELNNLGVRVATLEKKSDKLFIYGFLHLSDQVWNNSGIFKNSTYLDTPHASNDGHYPALGIDLYLNYKVNDKWQVKVEDEAVRDFRTGGYWSSPGSLEGSVGSGQRADQIYAEGTLGTAHVKAGKFDYSPAYGLVIAAGRKAVDGVQFTFGEKYKTTFTYGYLRQNWTGNALNPYIVSGSTDNRYAALEFDAAISKDAVFKTAYHSIKNDGSDSTVFSDNIHVWEAGVDKMLGKKLDVFATYAKSSATSRNSAYIAGLTYGHADLNVPGSFSVTGRYIKAEGYSTIAPDNYWVSNYGVSPNVLPGVAKAGFKGPELSTQIMFDKNVGMMAWAASLKATDGSPGTLNTVKAEFDFFF
ncbi:MAG TPA: S-layer homology domain-containing protein [Negativicutes bacterium]|jgi:hypothetical protein